MAPLNPDRGPGAGRDQGLDAAGVIAALPFPAVLVDRDERIETANAAAQKLFGHDGTGRHYVTALRQPATLDAVEATLRDGQPREARFLAREGGRETTWRVSARALPAGRLLLVFEDVTAEEEAGRSRRDFVANVGHELRTPLTALLGLVETLQGPARDDPPARDRFLKAMAREAERMRRLVDDLLSLSRLEAEERRRPTGRVDLAGLCRSVAMDLEGVAAQAGVAVGLDVPAGPVTVRGDEAQLRQVIGNLLENAVKYGGRVRTCRWRRRGTSRASGAACASWWPTAALASSHIICRA
jgi:two-component system phosphate regulon sensor histidine kinase PhoR